MDAAPFRLDGDDRGALLLHGFAGTPFAMRYLGDKLHARGLTAWGPLLPGHGSTAVELEATQWHDWLAAAEAELLALRARSRAVAVAGLSMGGLLALRLAQKYPDLRAIAVLAAPLWLPFHIRATVRALASLSGVVGPVPALPNVGGPDLRDPEMKKQYPKPPGFPVLAMRSLLELMRLVRRELPLVRVPTLVVHSDHDHTAPPPSAREIRGRIGAESRFVRLQRSFHIVTLDVERDAVAGAVGDFFSERM